MDYTTPVKMLCGTHILTGCDRGWDGDARTLKFELDGNTYVAAENPDDGWRSCLRGLGFSDEPCVNKIPPTQVSCAMEYPKENADDYAELNELLVMRDTLTGVPVIEIGTLHADGWYPYCVLEWHPENLACNMVKLQSTPEHVVLCRDCKHFIPDTDDTQHGDCDVWSDRIWCDFFCGFGQRGINE